MTSRQVSLPVLLLVFAVGTCVVPVVGQTSAVDSHAAQVELVGPSTVSPGERVTVEVNVTADRPIYAAQFALSFDGTVLEAGSVDRGDFLSRDARSILIANETGDGKVSYGETRIEVDTGVDGTGTLATVSFTVAEDATGGELHLELYGVKLATPAAEPVDTRTSNLTVAVDEADDERGAEGGSGGGGDGGGGQAGPAPEGEVEIAGLSLLNDTATTGATVVTRVDLVNPDPTSGSLVLNLTANGSAVTERALSVGASTERTVYLRHRFDQPGAYDVRVNGGRAGTITVAPTETPTAVTTSGTTQTRTLTASPGRSETEGQSGTETRTGTAVPSELPSVSPTPPSVSPTTTTGDGSGFEAVTAVVAVGGLVLLRARD